MEFMQLWGSITKGKGISRWWDIHSSTLFFISPLPAQRYPQWHLLSAFLVCLSHPQVLTMSSLKHWPAIRCHLKNTQVWCLLFGQSSPYVTDLVSVLQYKLCWQFHTHELTYRSAKERQLCNWWGPTVWLFGSVEHLGHLLYLLLLPGDSTETSL